MEAPVACPRSRTTANKPASLSTLQKCPACLWHLLSLSHGKGEACTTVSLEGSLERSTQQGQNDIKAPFPQQIT